MACRVGFGNLADGRPIWAGDFAGTGKDDVLFYYPGDGNWWLGSHDGAELRWSLIGNTLGANPGDPNFGQVWDGRPFWIGDFNGSGSDDVLFYYPGDGNWWLGSHDGSKLVWSLVGNTLGANSGDPNFGQIWDGRPFWIGKFNGGAQDDVLFYYPGDGNWWLGSHDGSKLVWSDAGNTLGANPGDPDFGQVWDDRPFWIGDFNGSGSDDVLFYYPGDGNWWLGSHDDGRLRWSLVGNTHGANPGDPNFGQVWDGRPFWIGDFNGSGSDDVLFYYPGDGNWWLGSHDGSQLRWSLVSNTLGANSGDPNFGQVWDGRPFWIGKFNGGAQDDVLFYYPGDGNWWLGSHDGSQLRWSFVSNTLGAGGGDPNFGQVWDGRPFWIGDFDGAGDDVLFYYPGDGNWWLGSSDGSKLAWSDAGNTGVPGSGPRTASPLAILLCRFNDSAVEPFPRSHYERLFTPAGAGALNMVDFFDHMSHCRLDIGGSKIFGWLTIDKKKSEYVGSGANPQGRRDLVAWAKQAARDSGVNLDDFANVVICMNVVTDLFGGPEGAVCDPGSTTPTALGQEVGHGFGLEHSRMEGTSAEYKDRWDAMSTFNALSASNLEFREIGPGLNAANMKSRGWLDESRVWRAAGDDAFDQLVDLRPLHHRELPGWLCIELPGGFLVEFRTPEDWDEAIPNPTLLVHRFEAPHSVLMHRSSPTVPPAPQSEEEQFQQILVGMDFKASVSSAAGPRTVSVEAVDIDANRRIARARVRSRP